MEDVKKKMKDLAAAALCTVTNDSYKPIESVDIGGEQNFELFKSFVTYLSDKESDRICVRSFYDSVQGLAIVINKTAVFRLRATIQRLENESAVKETNKLTERISEAIRTLHKMKKEWGPSIHFKLGCDMEAVDVTVLDKFTDNPFFNGLTVIFDDTHTYGTLSYADEQEPEEVVEAVYVGDETGNDKAGENSEDTVEPVAENMKLEGISEESLALVNEVVQFFHKSPMEWRFVEDVNKEMFDVAGMLFGTDKQYPLLRFRPWDKSLPDGKIRGVFFHLGNLAKVLGECGLYPQLFSMDSFPNGKMYAIAAICDKVKMAICNGTKTVRIDFEEQDWIPYAAVKEALTETGQFYHYFIKDLGRNHFELTLDSGSDYLSLAAKKLNTTPLKSIK